jgi:hypothetical protein
MYVESLRYFYLFFLSFTFTTFRLLYLKKQKQKRSTFNLQVNIQMEAQLLAADARFWAVPWSGGGGPVHVHQHGAFGKVADPSSAFVVNGHKSPAVRVQKKKTN